MASKKGQGRAMPETEKLHREILSALQKMKGRCVVSERGRMPTILLDLIGVKQSAKNRKLVSPTLRNMEKEGLVTREFDQRLIRKVALTKKGSAKALEATGLADNTKLPQSATPTPACISISASPLLRDERASIETPDNTINEELPQTSTKRSGANEPSALEMIESLMMKEQRLQSELARVQSEISTLLDVRKEYMDECDDSTPPQ